MADARSLVKCGICTRNNLRTLDVISRELREMAGAVARDVALLNPDASPELFATWVVEDLEQYQVGIARELGAPGAGAQCVYCAHVMPRGRREAFWAQNALRGTEVGHG